MGTEEEQSTEIDTIPIAEKTEQASEESVPQKTNKEILSEILSDKGISRRSRSLIQERNNNLKELSRTPRHSMEEMFSESEIRRISQILDDNGREHTRWFDE